MDTLSWLVCVSLCYVSQVLQFILSLERAHMVGIILIPVSQVDSIPVALQFILFCCKKIDKDR